MISTILSASRGASILRFSMSYQLVAQKMMKAYDKIGKKFFFPEFLEKTALH